MGSVAGDVAALAVLHQVCPPHSMSRAQAGAPGTLASRALVGGTQGGEVGQADALPAQPASGARTEGAVGMEEGSAARQASLAARSLVRGLTTGRLQDVIAAGQRLGWSRGELHQALGRPCAAEQELATKVEAAFAL